MDTKQISLQLAAAIFTLATSLTFISPCNSDDQEQVAPDAVAQDAQVTPSNVKREKKSINIRFKVRAQENGDEVFQFDSYGSINDDNCKDHEHGKGCFRIENGNTGLIKFTLIGHPQWKLTQLTICKGHTKEQCSPDLSISERLEFFVMDDENSKGGTILTLTRFGRIDLSQLPEDRDTFYLYDLNTFEQNYFYNIEVCNDAGKCLTLDPPVENKG